jgi:hypothetical protein
LDPNLKLAKYLKLITNDQFETVDKIRLIGNKIIHSKTTINETKTQIISIIKDTKKVIENLYS